MWQHQSIFPAKCDRDYFTLPVSSLNFVNFSRNSCLRHNVVRKALCFLHNEFIIILPLKALNVLIYVFHMSNNLNCVRAQNNEHCSPRCRSTCVQSGTWPPRWAAWPGRRGRAARWQRAPGSRILEKFWEILGDFATIYALSCGEKLSPKFTFAEKKWQIWGLDENSRNKEDDTSEIFF